MNTTAEKTHYRKDLSGLSFGRWDVISFSHKRGTGNMWNCVCVCGEKRPVYGDHLLTNKSRSCGCLRKEELKTRLTTHGETGSRLQISHTHMKQRCNNKSNHQYKNYGGRGILVCEEWSDFIRFKAWAEKNGYKENLTIDRIDNNKGYSPDNCRWVHHSIQNSNKRKSKNNTSGYIGVTERNGKYRCRVDYKNITKNIGTFETALQAAIARDYFVVQNNLPHTLNFKS